MSKLMVVEEASDKAGSNRELPVADQQVITDGCGR